MTQRGRNKLSPIVFILIFHINNNSFAFESVRESDQISILLYILKCLDKPIAVLPSQIRKLRYTQGISTHFVGVTCTLQSATLNSWVGLTCSAGKGRAGGKGFHDH